MSQVNDNNGQTARIKVSIASTVIVFPRSDPQQLLPVSKLQKDNSGKEICVKC